MSELTDKLEHAGKIAITGHINPDGDCVGSTLGTYSYIKKNYPDAAVTVFLKNPPKKFSYLNGFDLIKEEITGKDKDFDLLIVLDVSDVGRMGTFAKLIELSADSICIDHHLSNGGFAAANVIEPEVSSVCEVLFRQLDSEKIDKNCAEALYTGIIHDTGVFRYQGTTIKTLIAAGELMETGIDFNRIIDESFYEKSLVEQHILGLALSRSETAFDGKCIYSYMTAKEIAKLGGTTQNLDAVIATLRDTEGAECAFFLYELNPRQYKISLRSKTYCNVCSVAQVFGGGGHYHAAGANVVGEPKEIIKDVLTEIEKEFCETES